MERIQMVEDFGKLLDKILARALEIKPTSTIEPPLNKSDFAELFAQIDSVFPSTTSLESKKHAIETAARESFNNLLACTTTIDSPSFVNIWNLLDIMSILSDDDKTEPAVMVWLVEELFDSQTVAGCRKIFDYLESRRERIIAKYFDSKKLVILRSCNELLRRLSRAEDTAFCGRVFIFLFQSFPLGDKSSVNLRGEYHTENVTTFDVPPPKEVADPEKMDVDPSSESPSGGGTQKASQNSSSAPQKGVSFSRSENVMAAEDLYVAFWSLQQSFSQPKSLFDNTNFSSFKAGLEATMAMFKSVQSDVSGRQTKSNEEGKRGTKRKHHQGDDDLASTYNPKYLTSRDLFELEISDLSFRRHIIVQVLIVIEFLLSLSAKAKEKLSKALPDGTNKSVTYVDQVLSEEDTKWATEMKKSMAEYLKQGYEGAYFHRMVETVLSRDKNWARWKIENCPSIAKPSITPQEYASAKVSARKATTTKRPRPNPPIGSLDLQFLSEGDNRSGLDRLKDPTRYQLPSVKSFKSSIELDDMDIEMAQDEESKNAAMELKASKSWRAQRIASATQLAVFDNIQRSDKIDLLFQDAVRPEETVNGAEEESRDSHRLPRDRRPVVISDEKEAGKNKLITMLVEAHGKSLAKTVSHTTRPPGEKEVDGIDFHFVDTDKFATMRDGDQFLEHQDDEGIYYGTSRKAIEGLIAQGKTPILDLGINQFQQLKDQGFDARFISIISTDTPGLETQSRRQEKSSETWNGSPQATDEREPPIPEGHHVKTILNDGVEQTYKMLEQYIFGDDLEKEDVLQATSVGASPAKAATIDVEMSNGDGPTRGELVTIDTPAPEAMETDDAVPIAETYSATSTSEAAEPTN
ncbi:uncharacterized protein L3040_004409 [Drepanopeziza brunnea f. sp. 'multigermtubi']|uniref:Guanylate kinase n=1 Tax=Marssonina brunnea f. sp. multigermtubi (strain MB_m1) TaxID=1072389 RepID=K1WXV6_MARBU|nr:guanylate kinase [Drepanopeziza brunnea f. sp. 'multigermtubi' MB_m1]EKD17871.1 guanylate kinase [Drepanopeziza brunnea f. sp. 'multigermtubi' MB_m1]KAJ5043021.1 hypothetical protein L3040_004409 [Drepanopeziza brunnea f. sp. 'multigermtubi']